MTPTSAARATASAALATLLSLSLAACGSDEGDGTGESGETGGTGQTEDAATALEEALAVLPALSTSLRVVAREAVATRLGIEDADTTTYLDALDELGYGSTELVGYLDTMAEAPFDERDVVWAATALTEDDGQPTVYRLADDVDLDAVADDLIDAGLAEDEVAGRRHLSGSIGEVTSFDGLIGERYPASFFDVAVDPERHLLVVGVSDSIWSVVDGDAPSLGEAGQFSDVLEGAEDAGQVAALLAPRCVFPGGRVTPEQLSRFAKQRAPLERPVVTGLVLTGEDTGSEVSARLQFANAAAAASAVDARTAFLREGRSEMTGGPISDVLTATLTADGSLVTGEVTTDEPSDVLFMLEQGDGLFAC